MALSLPELLQPAPLNKLVSEINVVNDRFQRFFGANTDQQSGRNFAWDVFNETRTTADARSPGTPPSYIDPQSVGHVNGRFPRFHEALRLQYEQIHNRRALGGPSAVLDKGGANYIRKQAAYIKQRFTNAREFMFAAMCRGSLTYSYSGDNIKLSFSGGDDTVNFRVPAGNLTKLDMLGDGDILGASWATTSTPIVGDLYAINAAFENLVGRQLRHVWCTSVLWGQICANLQVIALAGSANQPFDYVQRADKNDFTAVLRGVPWVQFHITDGVLNVNGTVTKLIADTNAIFCPDPDPSWVGLLEGSEFVVEYEGDTETEQYGQHFWAKRTDEPAGIKLFGLDNCIPVLYNPACIAYGLCVY